MALRHLLVLSSCLLGLLVPAQAELLELRRAQVVTELEGELAIERISLPYNWDRQNAWRSGRAVLEIPLQIDSPPSEPQAVYFARVGNRAEIWLNGVLLSRFGDLERDNGEDYAKAPQQVLIPAQLLRRDNLFRVILHADGGRRGGLSTLLVGPEIEVREHYQEVYRWRIIGSIAVSVFSLLVGVIALLIWATQVERLPGQAPQRDMLYLSAGVAEICWMLRLSDNALADPPLAWPWWGMLQTVAYAGWFCGSALFCHHVAGWHLHPSMRWVRSVILALFITSLPAAWLALKLHDDRYLTGWYGFATFLFIGYAIVYFWGALRKPTTEHVLVATAGVFTVLVGFRDWMVIRAVSNFSEISWMRYASVMFGLALGYIVITRFREASAQARDLMDNMAAKVKEKEQALAASYQQLEQLAREQERAAERARILRDMHDGVGSHISTAIRQLQSGKASGEDLLQTLRDSLDQLKLSIDAMNLPPGDVTTLLANLRYRLEPRFKSSDITLHWDVDLLPPLTTLDDKAMRQLQFMVFEALSNVLQHAQASELRIELRAVAGGGARLRVVDNGRGFHLERVQRKGLASLRERAAAIGVGLEVSSEPGRTVVEIRLA
ncbi:MAG: sensor histidine kinase [Curvibacter sp.]|jgi:signal transduction histidine kinase|nr:histidine kinase [Curvibacter sp.]